MLALEVVEDFGQVAVGLDIARRQQEAYGWYVGVGISREWIVGKKETGPKPRLLLGFRWRRWWAVVGGASVRGFRLDDWGFGVGSSRKTDDPLGVGRDVAIGKQDRGLGRLYMHLMHQTLHKACVPVFFQQPKTGF